ncbi:hypothetical protein GCM10009527_021530 [Actinomadura nitritigenes]
MAIVRWDMGVVVLSPLKRVSRGDGGGRPEAATSAPFCAIWSKSGITDKRESVDT